MSNLKEIREALKKRAEMYWPLPGQNLQQTVQHELARQHYMKAVDDIEILGLPKCDRCTDIYLDTVEEQPKEP